MNIKDFVLRDTPYASLMNRRIYNVLLVATKYDAFMLEDDGRVDELIFNEYTSLSLRYPPRFTQVTDEAEALKELSERRFELVIVMPNMAGRDVFSAAGSIKTLYPDIPIVVLTPFSKEVSRRVAAENQHHGLDHIDYIFSWLGNSELLLAIIKLIEDKLNAPHDMASVGVQTILLVEDSVRFYSSALPCLYRVVLEQSREFAKEALNDHLATLRMRGRPKIMLARSYEEAIALFDEYRENILGVVSDVSFNRLGEKDPKAGFRLIEHILQCDHHIPIILESSEESNRAEAERLGANFIAKHSKSYPQDLRAEIMSHFGFGPFNIIKPSTGETLFSITTLKDLQKTLEVIPDDSLRYHLAHNHFSRFFYSRAMFPPAEILRHTDLSLCASTDVARSFVARVIASYRRMKHQGVVAIYSRETFDEFSNFARIGNGSLGGKGRGLAFMGSLVKRYPNSEAGCPMYASPETRALEQASIENASAMLKAYLSPESRGRSSNASSAKFSVDIPKTVVICTDVFDEFMEANKLYPIALSNASDEDILAAFEAATLPQNVLDDLMAMFRVVARPIAVRSSSLLEDSHYQPFAGVYATYMVPHTPDEQEMLRLLRSAIKAVYASVFYKESKAYVAATQNLIDQEKMAIVLQEVVGTYHDEGYFFPTLSGVARSINFYPVGKERPEQGTMTIAAGLGRTIVDGGDALRLCPASPGRVMQLSELRTTLATTQKHIVALRTDALPARFSTSEAFNLAELSVKDYARLATTDRRLTLSTFLPRDGMMRGGYYENEGRPVVTFSGLLSRRDLPLCEAVSNLLQIGSHEMGRPVEIEFAMNVDATGAAKFYLLQIRPIVDSMQGADDDDNDTTDATSTAAHTMLLQSDSVMGNGRITDCYDVIYRRSSNFSAADNRAAAAEIEALNAQLLAEHRPYVLVGPGRWGSSDDWLGVPVPWSSIGGACVIAECALPGYRIDPSQGTHFFQNLTSLSVGYFTISPCSGQGFFAEELLNQLHAETETTFFRHIHFKHPLRIRMSGRKQTGTVEMIEE